MGFKYVYNLLKNQASIVRTCSSKNEPVAVEYELAIKVLKRHARQNNKENPSTANNNRSNEIAFLESLFLYMPDRVNFNDTDLGSKINDRIAQLRAMR